MTDTSSVIREKRGQALWITINRPDKRNAINADVVAGIVRGYREAHDDKDVRVIVLTGAGEKAFCAGADLQNSGAAFAMDFSRPNVDYADLLRLSQDATKPAIARSVMHNRPMPPAMQTPLTLAMAGLVAFCESRSRSA